MTHQSPLGLWGLLSRSGVGAGVHRSSGSVHVGRGVSVVSRLWSGGPLGLLGGRVAETGREGGVAKPPQQPPPVQAAHPHSTHTLWDHCSGAFQRHSFVTLHAVLSMGLH